MYSAGDLIEFDEDFYRECNPDVGNGNNNLRLHYELYGWKENRNPSPYLDSHFYRSNYPEFTVDEDNPLAHYNKHGRLKGFLPAPPNSIGLSDLAARDVSRLRVAIHCQVDEVSLWPEVCEIINDLRLDVTLFVSTKNAVDLAACKRASERYPVLQKNLVGLVTAYDSNDLQTLLLDLKDEHVKFDVWGSLYTKYDANSPLASTNRGYQLSQMLGTTDRARKLIALVGDRDANCGLTFAENFRDAKTLIDPYQDTKPLSDFRSYPLDLFFWARSEALHGWETTDFNRTNPMETEDERRYRTMRTLCTRIADKGLSFKAVYSSLERPALMQDPAVCAAELTDPRGERWRPHTPAITDNRPLALSERATPVNSKKIDLHWIIPDFSQGGGGHMTIFRFVRLLETRGFRQTIWIQCGYNHRTARQAKRCIQKWYQPISDKVIVRFLPDDVEAISGDAVIATDCWSAFPVSRMTRFKQRFYFIQDWESEFHPAGDSRLVAGETYNFGFTALTAGEWLAIKAKEAGMDVVKWPLGADKTIYNAPEDRTRKNFSKPLEFEAEDLYSASKIRRPSLSNEDAAPTFEFHYYKNGARWIPAEFPQGIPEIAIYARGHTPRRAVELAISSLKSLAKRGWIFHVHFYGEEKEFGELPFIYTPHGLLKPAQLKAIYSDSDLGLAFSATNYSLVPLEMMACNLPVVEIDTESTRSAYPEGAVVKAKPVAYAIADEVEKLLLDFTIRDRLAEAGRDFIKDADWEKSVDIVAAAVRDRVIANASKDVSGSLDTLKGNTESLSAPRIGTLPQVSIFIPTYNAGVEFDIVLQAIAEQQLDSPFELVIIDSGSTDQTIDTISKWKDKIQINLQSISNTEFGHGRTRNQGIDLSEGKAVAILTQDACPASPYWLKNLIAGFDEGDAVAGVFGSHRAYPAHELFEGPAMQSFFESFRLLGKLYSADDDISGFVEHGSPAWQSALQFYSDNNSCIRKSVWKTVPYEDIQWGEDQVWAWQIARLGFQKVYAHEAAVYHSHDYASRKLMQVGLEEGRMFLEHFGMYIGVDASPRKRSTAVLKSVLHAVAQDEKMLKERNIDDEKLVLRRAVQHLALFSGRAQGVEETKKRLRK